MGKEIYHALLDPDYQDVYVDVDEIRTRKAPSSEEITYRYLHGGFQQKGVKFDMDSAKYDADGRMTVIYLADEFSGFAIHLVEAK